MWVSEDFSYDTIKVAQEEVKKEIWLEREATHELKFDELKSEFSDDLLFAVKLTQDKGASSWLNVHLIQEHGFAFTKATSEMPSPFDMDGRHQNFPLTVHVVKTSP